MTASKHQSIGLLLCLFSLLGGRLEPATAAVPEADIRAVRVGFQGICKIGRWVEVRVEFASASTALCQLVVHAPDPDGGLVAYPSAPFVPTADGSWHSTHVQIGRESAVLTVEVVDAESGESLAKRRLTARTAAPEEYQLPLHQDHFLMVTVGKPLGFPQLAAETADAKTYRGDREMTCVELDRPTALPTHRRAFDSVDALVIGRDFELSEAQGAALREWVWHGGHLLIAAGDCVESFAATSMASWLPLQFGSGEFAVRELSGLEAFVGGQARIAVRGRVIVPDVQTPEGTVLVPGPDRPIVLRVASGFGKVTFCGLDFDREPLQRWESLPRFCARLLGLAKLLDGTSEISTRRRLSRTGITDLATQLTAAQSEFSDVGERSSWGVMGWLLLLLLVIGPLDYLLVNRVLKRSQLAWVTFPLIVVGVSVIAVLVTRDRNGTEILVNTTEVIDLDGSQNRLRVRAWHTIYSPESQRYQVSPAHSLEKLVSDSPLQPGPASLRWSGIPESTFGGMYRSASFDLSTADFRVSPHSTAFENFPIPIWSSRAVQTEQSSDFESPLVTGELQAIGNGQLSGQIQHRLPIDLQDWIIIYGTRMYRPSNPLSPGVPFPRRGWERISQRELRGYLTETTTTAVEHESRIGREYRTTQTEYNPLNRDVFKILQMASFHQAAGGQEYTTLSNESLTGFDLSESIRLGRAVILARIELPTTQLEIDGQPIEPAQRQTLVRLVIPVEQHDQGSEQLVSE